MRFADEADSTAEGEMSKQLLRLQEIPAPTTLRAKSVGISACLGFRNRDLSSQMVPAGTPHEAHGRQHPERVGSNAAIEWLLCYFLFSWMYFSSFFLSG